MDTELDLDGYFARIGYRGPTTATRATLDAVTAAHATHIPFENVDVFLGHPAHIEPAAIYTQLVTRHRGGYCFQQNGLLLEMLRRIGFDVTPLSARTRFGAADRDIPMVRTHLFLKVLINGEDWFTDVGAGAASLTSAIRWQADVVQPTPHEPRRLVQIDGRWFHQVLHGRDWTDAYEFTGEAMPFIDRKVANWYTSTHPDSKFRRDLYAALALPEGRRVTLLNRELTLRERDGSATKQQLNDDHALIAALDEYFGIRVPATSHFDLPQPTGSSARPDQSGWRKTVAPATPA